MDNAMTKPKVSVIMPVYNAGAYLKESIESILRQTFSDFEFLILDDGSTDASLQIAERFKDQRIKILKNGSNKGLVFTLNRGLDSAGGAYIARMDADDISLPERLRRQVEFMDAHADIGVLGTWIETIEAGKKYINRYPTDPEEVRAGLLFSASMTHPSVIIRKSVVDEFHLRYDPAARHCEDYALWVELSRHTKLANIPEVLFRYRLYPESVSRTYGTEQRSGSEKIRLAVLAGLGLLPSNEERIAHNAFKPEAGTGIIRFLDRAERWFEKILDANDAARVYDASALKKMIGRRWYMICNQNTEFGLVVWKRFRSSPLSRETGNRDALRTMKMLLKCAARRNYATR